MVALHLQAEVHGTQALQALSFSVDMQRNSDLNSNTAHAPTPGHEE